MNQRKQKGFTGLELIALILAAIVVLLLILVWSSNRNTLANTCKTNLQTLQTQFDQWVVACQSGDAATQATLITSMNGIISQWNAGSCKEFATLIAQPADCPPTP